MKRHCEYAVLVSMLEPENELYNTGIVDKSHRYPKDVRNSSAVLYSNDHHFKKCCIEFYAV